MTSGPDAIQNMNDSIAALSLQLANVRALELKDAAAYLQAAVDAADLAREPGIPALLRITAQSELGNAKRVNGEFGDATALLSAAIAAAEGLPADSDRDAVLALTHLRQSIVCDLTDSIVEGVGHLDRASHHFRAVRDEEGLVRCDMVRAALYLRIDEFKESEKSYLRALAHYRSTDQSERIGVVLTNLSVLLRYTNRIDEAVVAGREAVSLARSPLLRTMAVGNLAFALGEAGQLDEALQMARQTEDAVIRMGDPNYMIEYKRAVATILLKKGQAAEARDLLMAALAEAEAKGYQRDFTDVHGLLADVFAALADFANAYKYQKKYHDMVQAQSRKKAASQLEIHKWRLELENTRAQAEQEKANRRLLTESLVELSSVNEQLSARAVELEWSSYRDSLTKLANRRYFDERLGDLAAHSLKSGDDLSIIMLDLDNFKNINDRFGHLKGDEVLRATARILQSGTRRSDLVARLGGEEFAVLLTTDMRPSDLHTLAEQLRIAFELHDWNAVNPGLRATVSLGAARLSEVGHHPLRLLELADQRLYTAKRSGRNRVVSGNEPM